MKKWIVTIVIVMAMVVCGVLLFHTNVEVEYVPETEIEEVDLRKTMVSLYFQNAESGELQKETRLIDSKELLLDPYSELLNMLIEGPESDSLKCVIPAGTKLLSAELMGDNLQINFSKEFAENMEDKEKCMQSILDTLTELNEVNSIKVAVEGEEFTLN